MESADCIQFITTRRGKTAVLYRGYRYYNVRALGHKVYWRCCTRSCCATLVTADGHLTKVGDDHNHPGDGSTSHQLKETLRLVKLETPEYSMRSPTTCAHKSVQSFKLMRGSNVQPDSVLGRTLASDMQISSISASRIRRDIALKLRNTQDGPSVKTKGRRISLCLSKAPGQPVTCLHTMSPPESTSVHSAATVYGVVPKQNELGPRNRGRGGIVPGPYMSRLATPTSTVVSATALKRARLQGDRVMPDGEGQHKVARQPVGSFTQLAGQQSYTSTMRPPRGVPTAVCPRVSREHRTPTPLETPIALQTPTSLQTPAHNSSERESLERAFFNPDHSSHIMTELSALWKSGKFLDAAILVGGMKLQAHRMVLFAASSYLRASFDHLNPNTELRLKMPPDIKLDIVFQFLTYIYDGVLKLNTSNVKPLLKISLMLRIDHLSSCCREFLAQAARSGVMAGVQEAAVHTPLLVLVDQRSRDTGHMKVDICTQTLPHTDEGGSPRAVPTLVDFERVFEEGAVERNVVQSDMDLYQEYKTGANTVAGTTDMHTYTSHDTDERVRPMVLIKNEFIDPEYDLSMGNQQITNCGGDEERMSSPSTTGLGCKQNSPVVLPVSGGGSTFCMGIMQVVPGLDLDVSSHSSNELGEHSFRYGVGRSQGAEGVVTGTENGGGGEEFSDKCKSTGETASAPHPQSTQIPTENVEPSSADIRQVHNIQRMDSPNTESGTRDTHTLCLRSSDLCESYSKESSLDEATKQFGTETFLASDLYVHSTKTEPKDPS